ncbi:Uncharacterised protein [Nocardia cyriacigeorgica]|uniref:Uncharacterized protein n=1 Tax=Nocardia cyriacigeorgica TaxID=135487 RepID=A0A4U8WC44_9NOCA|nr:Uncharacterised protein [Nocardia cyriacigeorgica]
MRDGSGTLEDVQVEFAPYGDFESDCPARMGVDLFGNTWLPVLVYLSTPPCTTRRNHGVARLRPALAEQQVNAWLTSP